MNNNSIQLKQSSVIYLTNLLLLLSVDTAPPGSHATANLGGAVFFVNNLGDVRPKL